MRKKIAILILSVEDDRSTDELIMWLKRFGDLEVLRLNDQSSMGELKLSLSNKDDEILINGNNLLKFDSIFIRNGQLPKLEIRNRVEESEYQIVKDFILYNLEKSGKNIGVVTQDLNHNKLIDFQIAKTVGLEIPDSWIIKNREQLEEILKTSSKNVLVKPLKNYYVEKRHKEEYILDLFELPVTIDDIPLIFFPSLIQKKIPKLFEVRVFFLVDAFYAIAIFSQRNKSTQLSFKNIDKKLMNRMVPFRLPQFLKKKIKLFFLEKNLNSGSIDLIYSPDKKFYFLEVNPVGQFNWVSKIGNYHIEKDLAKRLIA